MSTPIDSISGNLADNIRQLREARGLTQQQMAKISGLPRPTWSNLESGAANPTVAVLVKVATALQISVEEFDRLAVSAPRRAGDTHVRPCPCCGLMATQISNDCGHRIECSDCGLTTKPTATEAECRSLWNRREKPRQ